MDAPLKKLTIEGFKSIRKLEDFEIRNLNVLIGANGAGKSNFVEWFRLLRALTQTHEALQRFVEKAGGGDGLFFGGPKTTPVIRGGLDIGTYAYDFTLEPIASAGIIVSNEVHHNWTPRSRSPEARFLAGPLISKWAVYHFHDTSGLSPMRREQAIEDTAYMREDASNIAAFLRATREKHPADYALIRDTIRLVAPFFDNFLLNERTRGAAGLEKKVALDWHQKGSDFPFQAWHLSDGTLRFMCLATALLQPNPPPIIVIDEPELGLHPHALEVLAGLLQKAAQRGQVIVSTQSAPLLSQFEPEDVITVTRKEGASVFARLDRNALAEWLKDYTLGELWQKNVIEAGAGDD